MMLQNYMKQVNPWPLSCTEKGQTKKTASKRTSFRDYRNGGIGRHVIRRFPDIWKLQAICQVQ